MDSSQTFFYMFLWEPNRTFFILSNLTFHQRSLFFYFHLGIYSVWLTKIFEFRIIYLIWQVKFQAKRFLKHIIFPSVVNLRYDFWVYDLEVVNFSVDFQLAISTILQDDFLRWITMTKGINFCPSFFQTFSIFSFNKFKANMSSSSKSFWNIK